MRKLLEVVLILIFVWSCKTKESKIEVADHTTTTKIVFGSCSDQKRPLQLWSQMAQENAEYALLLGDNVYADHLPFSELNEAYNTQKNNDGYAALMNTSKIYGIWDDHDYGANDAGKYHVNKDSAQIALFNFLDISEDDPLRQQKGAYQSHDLEASGKTIRLLLLDTRYFRDTLVRDTTRRYLPNTKGDILGEEQWDWLEKQLTDSKANLHLIASSIQIIPEEHPYEKWSNFPNSRKRLFDLIQKKKPANVVMLSGDRHISEISKLELTDYPAPIYDLTSSGLSHTWRSVWKEPNKYRVKDIVIKRSYGLLTIDWHGDNPKVQVDFKGHQDSTFLSLPLAL